METAAVVIAIVTSAVGATWVLRDKLSSIENTLSGFSVRLRSVEGKVIKLEARNKRR